MNPKFILLGLVLIFLSFLSQQAFASNPSCNDISLNTYTARVEAGKSIIESFSITNNASERFFIDSVNAFDSSQNFDVEQHGYDRTVLSQGTGTINITIIGKNYNSEMLESAFIELRGHFLNGNSCNLQDIGAKKFNVIVEKPVQAPSAGIREIEYFQNIQDFCEGINLIVKNEITIKNSAFVELIVDNASVYRVNVRLSGENVFVDPALISVPKNSKISEKIFVSTTEKTAILNYLVESPNCSFSKTTIINSEQEEEKKLSEIVSINATVSDANTGYEVIVSLQNKFGEKIFGNLGIIVPANWKILGEKNIALAAFEAKKAKFSITPDTEIQKAQNASISFNSNGESISLPIKFEPKENQFQKSIAGFFALLGNNLFGIGIGILVILILIVFLLAFYSRKQIKPVILITKPQEVKT